MGSEFPGRLRKLRERRRIDQKTLGECCGLSKSVIGRYERGERIPDINTAMQLADFFGVTLDYLCGHKKIF